LENYGKINTDNLEKALDKKNLKFQRHHRRTPKNLHRKFLLRAKKK